MALSKSGISRTVILLLIFMIFSGVIGAYLFKQKTLADVADEAEQKSGLMSPTVTVYKSASCGCCNQWVDHLAEAGFTVTAHNREDMNTIKQESGVVAKLASCHTAFVNGYVIEGHVPASDIKRLLSEKPAIHGLTAPGMPQHSPGMQAEGLTPKGYAVLAFNKEGETSIYQQY